MADKLTESNYWYQHHEDQYQASARQYMTEIAGSLKPSSYPITNKQKQTKNIKIIFLSTYYIVSMFINYIFLIFS